MHRDGFGLLRPFLDCIILPLSKDEIRRRSVLFEICTTDVFR